MALIMANYYDWQGERSERDAAPTIYGIAFNLGHSAAMTSIHHTEQTTVVSGTCTYAVVIDRAGITLSVIKARGLRIPKR